ncbi:hypothetical protein SNE40_017161 [Patella caerulea]|uniref:Uncharacterized protein n=1 Tax=Patella caerulea TaxID=87958 RepID=A0AAN8PDJ2_PATCE
MLMKLCRLSVYSFILIVIFISLVTCAAFPRQRRQSFFQCSGWGAGCTNSAYPSQKSYNDKPKDDGAGNNPRGHPSTYLFTSGSSWSVIGKRFRPAWSASPRLRRVLSPIIFSSDIYERLMRKILDSDRLTKLAK